jgi:large subunit ribosomal protein L7/L12
VKDLGEKWGISASVPLVAVAMPLASAAAEVEEEKTEFEVVLKSAGDNKMNVAKEVRAITGLWLTEAKKLVDGALKPVKKAVQKADAEEVKKKL